MPARRLTAYRYSTEQWILYLSCIAVLFITLITAVLTFRIGLILIAAGLLLTYFSNRVQYARLLRQAMLVSDQNAEALTHLARECASRLGCDPFQLFIARSPALNAFTFGLRDPKIVVLHSALFNEMDADEIRFILGHELGHICLGHTWLNSIAGGMTGISSSFLLSTLLRGIFLWWSRACEKSADRAGMLACGRLDKALSALLKLAAGPDAARRQVDFDQVLRLVEAEGTDSLSSLQELAATHPLIIHRMTALKEYSASRQYQALKMQIDQQIGTVYQ